MNFAKSLAITAVQEQANRDAQDVAVSQRWVAKQVAAVKSKCVAASKRCEFSATILTDSLPSLHQKQGHKQLLKDLQSRLGQLGFTKLQVTEEISGEDAGKVCVAASWAGLQSQSMCFDFVRTLPTLLTKGVRKPLQPAKRLSTAALQLPMKPQEERNCRSWSLTDLSALQN